MKQRVSLITLGVSDLGRARRFHEALGSHPWEVAHNPHWTITEDGGVRLG
jgi:hypothetical protein